MKSLARRALERLGLFRALQPRYWAYLRWRQRARYRRAYKPFAGAGFTCNACGARYSRFAAEHPLPEDRPALERHHVVAGYGEAIICPNCLSTARERLVIACLQDIPLGPATRVLHLSPERQVYALLARRAHVTTADLEPDQYRGIDPRVSRQDATALAYADGSFDLVVANHVLEHIPDDASAMREFFRVLKPGGRAILQVPYAVGLASTIEDSGVRTEADRSRYFGQADHVRLYTLDDYRARLTQAGFHVALLPAERLRDLAIHAIQPGEAFLCISKP